MLLFFIGIVEMLIVTFWTKMVSETRIWPSGFITMINVLIWYYVLQKIVDDIQNWQVAVLYAFGCSIGTVISTAYFRLREARETKSLSLSN